MVRKGLSADEKREKILGIYHSTKTVFNLKDIEKAASKQGVVSQTVKVKQRVMGGECVFVKDIAGASFSFRAT